MNGAFVTPPQQQFRRKWECGWLVFDRFTMPQDVLYALVRNRAREHRLACVNAIDKFSILHPRPPSTRFPVLYHRKKKEHSVGDRPRRRADA